MSCDTLLRRSLLSAVAVCLAAGAGPATGQAPGAGKAVTPEKVQPRWSLRVYAVGDLLGDKEAQIGARSLAEAVRGCVQPESWREWGGEASISIASLPHGTALVVRQTDRAHQQTADLLAKLRRAARPEKRKLPDAVSPEEKIAKALANRTDLAFRDTPLDQAVGTLARKHGIPIRLDTAALARVGIKPDVPITVQLSGVSLRSALRLVLRRLDLVYTIRGDSLVITTPEAVGARDETGAGISIRVYPIADLTQSSAEGADREANEERDVETLLDVMATTCSPVSWEDFGAVRAVSLGGFRALVVRQTDDGHAEIADLLAAIRRVVREAAEGKIAEPSTMGTRISDAERRVLNALAQPFSCDFQKTPLADVAAFIREKAGIGVVLDRRSLEDVGLGPDTPVTFRVSGITLRSALRLMLRDLDLTFVLQDEVLLITTPEMSEEQLTTAVFAVPDLVTFRNASGEATCDFQPLVDLVTSTVRPDAWDDVGGPGFITGCTLAKARFVVVSQTQDVLKEVVDLLSALRQIARQRAAGKIPEVVMVGDPGKRTPAVEAIHKALEKKLSFEFVEKPLADVAAEIGKRAGINVLLDRKALDDVGIGSDTPITKQASDVSLRQFLRLVLRELDLTYVIRDEVLLITTPEEAESRLLVGIYPVPDLAAARDASGGVRYEYEALLDLITCLLRPDTWDEVGGPGFVGAAPFENVDALVVCQTPDVHEEIGDLLAVLREVARRTAEDPAIGAKQPFFPLAREDSPRMAAIRQALGKKATLRLDKEPLAEVVRSLKKTYKIQIQVDARALRDVGLDSRMPVSIDVKGISLGSALRLLLRPPDLTYIVVDEVLLITTPEETEYQVCTHIYPVGDLVTRRDGGGNVRPDLDRLVNAITRTIFPESWDNVGGLGSIVPWSRGGARALVVSQTQEVHEAVVKLLAEFRKHVRRGGGK